MPKHGRQRGFTMIELVIVLIILAMLAGIGVPRMANAIAHHRADTAAQRIAADLEYARHRAVHTSIPQTVAFNDKGCVIEGASSLESSTQTYRTDLTRDPYGARIVTADFDGDQEVSFDIYGHPDSDGVVVIQVGSWQQTITLDAETGRATIE